MVILLGYYKVNKLMNLITLVLFSILLIASTCNSCINKHCKTQQTACKQDKTELPCPNVINTCLDLCPSNTNYGCLSFCLSSRKNTAANNFLKCCTEFGCKVQKFTALVEPVNLQTEENVTL